MMRVAWTAAIAGLAMVSLPAQSAIDAALRAQLSSLFPAAAQFSGKAGEPPHYKALGAGAAGSAPVLGYAFWTTELEPLERGFDGPIKMLVGMNTAGEITGVIVTDHREPYGYFSVDLPDWPKQFEGKSIRDAFKVGADVDAISRATITVQSASRAIRNSSRKIARAHLAPPSDATASTTAGQ
jgi:transcriptional regulator of nitric oxide reductase